MKKRELLVIILFIPLIFISPKHSHDWGDDFAQYIHQAGNILQGKSQSDCGYIFNPENCFLGPRAYPIGFPLLLAPVYLLKGNNIAAFSLYMSVLLVVLSLVVFVFHRKYFSFLTSVLLAVIFVCNPLVIQFKAEVMSEIPFTIFLLLATMLYMQSDGDKKKLILAGVLAGFMIHIRTIGIVFPAAVFIDYFIKGFRIFRKDRNDKAALKNLARNVLYIALPFLAMYYLLVLLFPLPGGYINLIDFKNLISIFLDHLNYNVAVFHAFFMHYAVGKCGFLKIVLASGMLTLLLIGMFKKMTEQIDFIDWMVLLYIFIILSYAYGDAGFRFIFPIFPFLINYVVCGFKSIDLKIKISKRTIGLGLVVLLFLQYSLSFIDEVKCTNCELPGPQEKESVEAFNYIKLHTPENSRILFAKPRALALYTGRSGFANKEHDSTNAMQAKFDAVKIDYYLLHTELSDDSLKAYITGNPERFKMIWSNAKFSLYK